MTVSILQVLATLPSGEPGVPLTLQELGSYLHEHCNTQAEKDRNERHLARDEFYRDGGAKRIEAEIDRVFTDTEVRKLRKAMIPMARFNNVVKRIVKELSTVYAAPAERRVGGSEDNQRRYSDLLRVLQFDLQMLEVNRLLNLHRALLVGFRVRKLADGTREPCIDIATPAIARAVLHPNDNKIVIGWLIRTDFRSKRSNWLRKPAWTLWTDHEFMFVDEAMMPLEGTHTEHGLGVNRWVPITTSLNAPGFWPGEEGEDLISAQKAIALISVLMVKETKSTTKQTIFTGDTSTMPRGQPIESERGIEAPEGVGVTTVDWGTDPENFISPSDHVLERTGNNYGMSMAQMTHQGVQSAEARELQRVPIREQRREQQPIFRSFEGRFARVQSAVLAKDDPERAFDAEDFGMDFGEAQTPLSPREELDLFEKERAAGVTNTVAFLRKRNPDLDDKAAEAQLANNIEVETDRIELMRTMQALSGGPSEGAPGDELAWVDEVIDAA